ncbi:MAG: hypothetical protein AB7V50_09170 [Vampirovibrionia bacterium]
MNTKIEQQPKTKKYNILACLLNGFIYPGFGELSIGHTKDGKLWVIYYTIWSILAIIGTIFSIILILPVILIDTLIRIYSAFKVISLPVLNNKIENIKAESY